MPKRKYSNDLTVQVYQAAMGERELQELRQRLAKTANKRLYRLGKAQSAITGEKYDEYGAAQIAYDYLQRQDRKKFSESLGKQKNKIDLKREITLLQGFLTSKSSTVTGQRAIEKKRVETFSSGKWGRGTKEHRKLLYASNKDFYDFMSSQTKQNIIANGFSSETVVELYDMYREKGATSNDILDAMESAYEEWAKGKKATYKGLVKKLDAIELH